MIAVIPLRVDSVEHADVVVEQPHEGVDTEISSLVTAGYLRLHVQERGVCLWMAYKLVVLVGYEVTCGGMHRCHCSCYHGNRQLRLIVVI